MKFLKSISLFTATICLLYISVTFITSCSSEEATITEIKVVGEDEIFKPQTVEVKYQQKDNNCTTCHDGLEPMRAIESGMMQEILEVAEKSGNSGNDCIVCHGGTPSATQKDKAHDGTIDYFLANKGPKNYYPDPGSPWINDNTCGTCHEEQVRTQFTSLMFTEAGKIQGTLWGFGGMNGYKHDVGNYDVQELKVHETLGTDIYKEYMAKLKTAEPNVYPSKMKQLPAAPTAAEVDENPELAVYTYIRQECNRCHTGSGGRQKRGDFRGLGCTSCHIAYSNEGYYEGKDKAINKEEQGHLLVHSMQSSRKCKVKVNGHEYSGIPVETCTTCHNRGKRIGTSYQGIMETSYASPFLTDGRDQQKLHTKKYLKLHQDIHLEKGMLCQDCHTSNDVHSDGNLTGATLAPVEIECQDCHGTINKFPWELPLGYSDEIFGDKPAKGEARGLTKKLQDYLKHGTVYDPQDGYLISARGNPITNVVRVGDSIILHTAGGKDLNLKPLKSIYEDGELSEKGEVAMVTIGKHMDNMECYTCHADWAPQCYGCHIKVDFTQPCKKKPDWIAMGQAHDEHGLTADARGEYDKYLIDGEVTETRSYLRWENPPLVMNGEHRISPAIPGCQTTVTVIGQDGKPLLTNHIFKIPNVEGAAVPAGRQGDEGQLAIDISPVQPHTVSKGGRECESCHTNPQSMGYGIEGGKIYADPSQKHYVDLMDADGNVLTERGHEQMNAIPNLKMDWSRFIDEDGKQLQTVGHHFSGSRPLNEQERAALDRRGVCLSCHKLIPEGDMAIDLISHVKEVKGEKYDTDGHNNLITKITKTAAWAQVLVVLFVFGLIVWFFLKRKKKG